MKGGEKMSKFMKFLAVTGLALALFAVSVADQPSDQADGVVVQDESAGGVKTNATSDPGGGPGGV